jgi:hypothetical protein
MKTPEDEAFDDLAQKQGMWGGGFNAKRQAAMDKVNSYFDAAYKKMHEDRAMYGTSWEKDGERIDPMSVYKEPAAMDDRQRLEAIVSVINKYLPPLGMHIMDAMSAIISLVDPLPAPQPVQEPETFERWNAKQHGDPEEIGFLQALRIAYCAGQNSVTTPPLPAQEPVDWLTDDERKALKRFMETCDDGEGYDVPKQMMKRLAVVGAVQHIGGGIYGITEFGNWLLDNTTTPQRERVVFPTMLRKMWSGGEVQAWLDENVNKEKNNGT